jgi:hypothetical protein
MTRNGAIWERVVELDRDIVEVCRRLDAGEYETP